MTRAVEIERMRGIRKGKLDDLAPLTILVGPNGSGKSTVLDALLIGASPNAGEALDRSIRRRKGLLRPARWLVWRSGKEGNGRCVAEATAGDKRSIELRVDADDVSLSIRKDPAVTAEAELAHGANPFAGSRTAGGSPHSIKGVSAVRLLDAYVFDADIPLHQLYSDAVEQGRGVAAQEILTKVVPGLKAIQILTDRDDPILHLVFDEYSVPVVLAGDGVQMLLRLALELASRGEGVVLMEEPEVHQHPGSIRQSALAILAAVRRDIQVVLTTHSLELIDALLDGAPEKELERIAVYRVQLEDGVLNSHRLSGTEAAFARTQIEDDLR